TGAALPLGRLLEGPSLAQLARTLEAAADRSPAPAAQPRTDDETQLSHGQRSMWFLHQLAPESPAYHLARAFQLRGPLAAAALRRAFERLHERHAALRTTYAAVD